LVTRYQPQAVPKKRRFTFFADVIGELRKVTWPSRRDTIRLTGLVILVCVLVGAFLGALDFGFTKLVSKLFLRGG